MSNIFGKIILNARPAAGKSEIIHFLKSLSEPERIERFHIGKMHIIDDFPILWRWFEEDSLLEKLGKPRLFTDQNGYFKEPYLWDLLIQMLNLEYAKFIRDNKEYDKTTIFFEFSRGNQHGGYQRAYENISKEVFDRSVIFYIQVSWEESLRKNRARFNPDKPDSILEHGLPDEKLEYLYRHDDFNEIVSSNSENGYLNIEGNKVPYAIFANDEDVTTKPDKVLEMRLERTLSDLWKVHTKN